MCKKCRYGKLELNKINENLSVVECNHCHAWKYIDRPKKSGVKPLEGQEPLEAFKGLFRMAQWR